MKFTSEDLKESYSLIEKARYTTIQNGETIKKNLNG